MTAAKERLTCTIFRNKQCARTYSSAASFATSCHVCDYPQHHCRQIFSQPRPKQAKTLPTKQQQLTSVKLPLSSRRVAHLPEHVVAKSHVRVLFIKVVGERPSRLEPQCREDLIVELGLICSELSCCREMWGSNDAHLPTMPDNNMSEPSTRLSKSPTPEDCRTMGRTQCPCHRTRQFYLVDVGQLGKGASLDRRNPSVCTLLLGPVVLLERGARRWLSHEFAHRERCDRPRCFADASTRVTEPMRYRISRKSAYSQFVSPCSLVDDCRLCAFLKQTSHACTSAVLGRRIEPMDVGRVHVLIRLDGVVQVEPPLPRKPLHNDAKPR